MIHLTSYGLKVYPSKILVAALIPNMIALGDGPLEVIRFSCRHKGRALHDGISIRIRRGRETRGSLSHVRTQWKGSQQEKGSSAGIGSASTLILVSLASINVRNKCLLFKPSGPWNCVVRAQLSKTTSN